MSANTTAIDTRSIVLLGNFNPYIFQPDWFIQQGLLGSADLPWLGGDGEDREKEEIGNPFLLITPEFTRVQMAWGEIASTSEQFSVRTTRTTDALLAKDLLVGTFTYLGHTPVRGLGFSRAVHHSLEVDGAWEAFAAEVTPSGEWISGIEGAKVHSLTLEGVSGRDDGSILVTVEKSNRLPNGVYIAINDHFERETEESVPASAQWVVDLTDEYWAVAQERADKILLALRRRIR